MVERRVRETVIVVVEVVEPRPGDLERHPLSECSQRNMTAP